MRDLNLKGETFTFVQPITGDDRITDSLRDDLLGAMGVTASEYGGTLTVVCSGLVGLGSLADIATDVGGEGPDLGFRAALGRALVERIG